MKKIWLMLLATIFTVSLLGCAKKEEAKVLDLPESATENWGLKISIKDVTETGGTLVFEQSGGNPTGELDTGEDYKLYEKKNGKWAEMPYLMEEFAWDSIAYIIANDNTTEMDVNWEGLYGKLSAGTYLIEKEVMDFRGSGDYDKALYYAEFEIK